MRGAAIVAGLGLVLAATAAGAAQADTARRIHDAIAGADSAALNTAIVDHYLGAGNISWNEFIDWRIQPFDWVFNYYEPFQFEIVIGALPTPEETDRYWDNWSATLAGGNWDRTSFFADAREAHLLAGYNQLMLSAHEAGHALAYRYDFDHLRRHNYAVNCRELYADRFAVALVKELSAADPRLARLEARYGELMVSFNAAVDEEHRYRLDSLDELLDACEAVKVDQPTPETLQPYASAFFERQRLLLAAPAVPLAYLYEELLLPHAEIRQPGEAPLVYVPDVGPVETLAHLPHLSFDGAYDDETRVSRRQLPAFTAQGSLFVLDIVARPLDGGEDFVLDLVYGPAGGARETIAEGLSVEGMRFTNIGGTRYPTAVADGEGGFAFIAELGHASDVSEGGIVLFSARREPFRWRVRAQILEKDVREAVIGQRPDGGVALHEWPGVGEPWRTRRLDLPGGGMGATLDWPFPEMRRPLLADGSGGGFMHFSTLIYRLDADGTARAAAGRKLTGYKDSDQARLAEFGDIRTIHRLPDGDLLVISRAPQGGTHLRRVVIHKKD